MLASPGEAKFKYCPFLMTHDDKMKFCQATMCMMWRYAEPGTDENRAGYCGLAGQPGKIIIRQFLARPGPITAALLHQPQPHNILPG